MDGRVDLDDEPFTGVGIDHWPSGGAFPAILRVLGDFSGPGIEGSMALSTVPNEPFRIPRLRVKGASSLSNIRLVQDGEILGYAEPPARCRSTRPRS